MYPSDNVRFWPALPTSKGRFGGANHGLEEVGPEAGRWPRVNAFGHLPGEGRRVAEAVNHVAPEAVM